MLFSYRVLQLRERETTNYKYSNSYTGLLKVTFKRRKEGNVLFNDVRHMVKAILIVRKETRCRHISYSLRLTARVLLYAPSHRQDSTHHDLCYTSRGALAGTRNSSMGPPHEDRSDDPSHHERTPLPRSYISLQVRLETKFKKYCNQCVEGYDTASNNVTFNVFIISRQSAYTLFHKVFFE